MITLTKQGSSLIVTSDDINVFPFKDGTISLPMNSLYIIIDESNYVSFKQVNDNNQLFGTEIDKLTINGTLATKENIIQLFDSVANAVSTGGGGEGGAVSSVNGQTGAVIITPENIGAYSTTEADSKFATIDSLNSKQDELVSGTNIKTINNESILGEGNITIDVDTSNLLTKDEASETYQVKGDYALKSEIPSLDGYATEAFVNEQISAESTERQKQDTALGGMIAAETEAREEAISALTETVNSKANTSDLSNYLLKTDAESTYAKESEITNLNNVKLDKSVYEADKPTFALKTEIPDTSNFITNEELEGKDYATEAQLSSKQDTLISGQNIKTINSQSLLGEGNIEITVEGGGISDAPNDDKLYGRKNEQWTEVIIPDTSNLATKEELESKADLSGAQFSGNVATPNVMISTPQQGIMYSVSSTLQDVSFRTLNAGIDSVSFSVQSATPLKLTENGIMENGKMLKDVYAKIDNIPTVPTKTSELQNDSGFITKTDADKDYALKSEIPSLDGYATETYVNEAISGKADKTELSQYETSAHASETYQPKGDYLTSIPDEYVTDTELNSALSTKLDSATYEADKPTFALKSEIPTDYVTEDDLTSYATKEELNAKQDTLVSGENIKTINNTSILGSGNITTYQPNEYDFNNSNQYNGNVVQLGAILKNIKLDEFNYYFDAIITSVDTSNVSIKLGSGYGLKRLNSTISSEVPFPIKILYNNSNNRTTIIYNEDSGSGGTEYTAGSGITISEDNVISLDYNVFDFSGNTSTNITIDGIFEKIKMGDILKNVVYSSFNLSADFFVTSVVKTEVGISKKNVVCLYNSSSINSDRQLQFLILRISDNDNVNILRYSSIDTQKLNELKEEWFGTTEEYNAITSKDENTLYYITDDVTE